MLLIKDDDQVDIVDARNVRESDCDIDCYLGSQKLGRG
jgi:hypothetical protein